MKEETEEINMELNKLLGIGDFMLVEESYASQKWLWKTLEYLRKIKREDVVEVIRIFDERKERIGIAVYDRDLGFWLIFTDVIADRRSKEEFEALASVIKCNEEREVEVKRERFREGVIEFYSIGLVNRLFCDCDLKEVGFYPKERTEVLKKVLGEFLMEKGVDISENKKTLEIGCGNGGGTIALHESDIFPFTIDINKCEICKGLEEGVLEPPKSIVLDCSALSSFFGKEFDVVFGFMVGKIEPFNRFEWERVLREAHKVLKSKGNVLFTVSSEEEAIIVKEILTDKFEGGIRENKDSDGYIDQWVYMGELRD